MKITKFEFRLVLFLFGLLVFLSNVSCFGIPESRLRWYISRDEYKDKDGNYPLKSTDDGDMIIVDNKLIAVREKKMVCIDKNNGNVLWIYECPHEYAAFQRTPIMANNKIFNVNQDGTIILTVLNLDGTIPNDFSPQYYTNLSGTTVRTIPAQQDDKIYVQLEVKKPWAKIIATIDINTYQIEEFINLGKYPMLMGRLVINGNLLYIPYSSKLATDHIGNEHAGLYCYDLTTKELLWEVQFRDQRDIVGHNPILYDNRLFVAAAQTTWVVDAISGEIKKELYGQGANGMTVGENSIIISDYLIDYDLNTYEKKWYIGAPYTQLSGAAYHNGVFYLMNYGLMAIDEDTGEFLYPHSYDNNELWNHDITTCMPIADEDTIYVNGLQGIYAFKPINYPK